MAVVLCYGDSNTWGYVPVSGERMGRAVRWPGVAQSLLGEDVHVIEEGLSGRTSAYDDPLDPRLNGLRFLPVCLATHAPLDVVVLMLGTNDPWLPGRLTAYDAARGVGALVDCVDQSQAWNGAGVHKQLVVVPPPLGKLPDEYAPDEPHVRAESERFSAAFASVVGSKNCTLLDLRSVVTPSVADGVHYDAAGHQAIGAAVAGAIRSLLDAWQPRNQ